MKHQRGSTQPSAVKRLIAERASIALWLQQNFNMSARIANVIASQHQLGGPLVYEAVRAGY